MDMTYSQILTSLKYPRGPLDQASKWKKAGFFESERSKIEPAWNLFGMQVQQRFPLSYLVEAADDISYCIGDMEDGIDQSIFTPRQFFDQIRGWVQKEDPSRFPLTELRKEALLRDEEVMKTSDPGEAKDHFIAFKTRFTATMIEEAARLYGCGDAEDIRGGTRVDLLEKTDAYDLLESLKEIARRFLYTADIVQRPFLAGLKVVTGILGEYSRLLELTGEQFALLRRAWRSADRGDVIAQDLETLLPLLDGLPAHYIDVYDSTAFEEISVKKWGSENSEWFCRAHLIVDYLSGMSDDFAYRTYQVISGARLD